MIVNGACWVHSHLCDAVAEVRKCSRVSVSIDSERRSASTLWASMGPVLRASCLLSSRTTFSQLRARFAAQASTRWWCRKLPGSFCPEGTFHSTRSPRHLKQPQGIPEISSNVRFVLMGGHENGNSSRAIVTCTSRQAVRFQSVKASWRYRDWNIHEIIQASDFR